MIIDSSAILAILFREDGFESLVERLLAAESRGVATPTLAEAGIVLAAKLGTAAHGLLDRFLREFEVATIAFEETHWREAVEAYLRFGKGRHRASLNFGDCMSYAAAKVAGSPLLFVGRDFERTDIEPA